MLKSEQAIYDMAITAQSFYQDVKYSLTWVHLESAMLLSNDKMVNRYLADLLTNKDYSISDELLKDVLPADYGYACACDYSTDWISINKLTKALKLIKQAIETDMEAQRAIEASFQDSVKALEEEKPTKKYFLVSLTLFMGEFEKTNKTAVIAQTIEEAEKLALQYECHNINEAIFTDDNTIEDGDFIYSVFDSVEISKDVFNIIDNV